MLKLILATFYYLPLGFLIALTSCETTPQNSDTARVSVEYMCVSAAASLETVRVLNAKLTPANRKAVAEAVYALDPICGQKTLPDITSVQRFALTTAVAQLTNAALQVQYMGVQNGP